MYDLLEQHYKDNHEKLIKQWTRRCGPTDAQDVVQEGYCRAFTYMHTYKGPSLDTWLGKIMYRAMCDLKRQDPEMVEWNEELDHDFGLDPYTAALAIELEADLRSLISMKTPKEADILELLLFQDRSVFQTAKEADTSPHTVWGLLRRFKREIKESGVV